eukprot:TRINITY_DN24424_c0_g1_i1.p2 TRINITY_DN24424_c0_g1~~TRINITY_DN24424_c0_g1_i1.p2  ORF type:complete len:275 (-),score=26.48 TRINITY_DN24424_c0_g1_i1:900-1724(-)
MCKGIVSVAFHRQATCSTIPKTQAQASQSLSPQSHENQSLVNRRLLIGGGCVIQQYLLSFQSHAAFKSIDRFGYRGFNSMYSQSQADGKTIDYFSPGGFKLTYPKGWLLAYDRSTTALPSTAYGTFFLCGDFKRFETTSVSRMTEDDYGLQGVRDTQDVLEQILNDAISSESTYDFRFLSQNSRRGKGKQEVLYVEGEYVVGTCRGEVIEGKGGTRMCQSKRLERVQPVFRHHIITVAIRDDGMVYVLNATAPENSWEDAKQRITLVQSSFTVA